MNLFCKIIDDYDAVSCMQANLQIKPRWSGIAALPQCQSILNYEDVEQM